jgi:hypothetical protein
LAGRRPPGGARPAAAARRPGGSTGGGPTAKAALSGGLLAAPALRWLGRLPTWTALLVVGAAALVGALLTLMADQEPGVLLGVFVILGTLVAAFGIRRRVAYLVFPAPALAFFGAALITGLVHDRSLTSSTAGLGAGSLQWFAGIFFPMVVATILAVVIGGGRWLFGTLFGGQWSPSSAGRPKPPGSAPGNARPAPRTRRPAASESWAADDPFADRVEPGPGERRGTGPRPSANGTGPRPNANGTGPRPNPNGTGPRPNPNGTAPRPNANGSRPARPPRDQRTDLDPWGDPRLPSAPRPGADRGVPANPRPRSAGPAPQPRDRAPRSQPPAPSWNPAAGKPGPRPARPRRQPPEGWSQR